MRVLRVYHAGRHAAHRERERALQRVGVDVTLVVPATWPDPGAEERLSPEQFAVIERPVRRAGDVNRHSYTDRRSMRHLMDILRPDVLDIHEEPFSVAGRQWLSAARDDLATVMYTAQNVDKRFPPPFSHHERLAHARIDGLYPCSKQAASVARGKGFTGAVEVTPLGYDPELFRVGQQSSEDSVLVLGIFGRLVPEKGLTDAVRVLARLHALRPTRLVAVGEGPDGLVAQKVAAELGVLDRLEIHPWKPTPEVGEIYRQAHVVLVPSRPTHTWVEQFGRVIVEAQASGALVAGYDSGSIAEVGGSAAIVVGIGDEARLAERIAEVVSNATLYQTLRDEGTRTGKTRTWDHVATQQAAFYERVAAGGGHRLKLPRSPGARRERARLEFGPPASTLGGRRPFALPVLRRGGVVASFVGGAIDRASELWARAAETG